MKRDTQRGAELEQEMGVFKQVLVVLSSLTALIQTAPAPQEGSGPQPRGVWRRQQQHQQQPLHSAAAESVCIGANCFFNYRRGGNAARCRLFGDDSHRELLSIMSHKLQTTCEEWGRLLITMEWHCVIVDGQGHVITAGLLTHFSLMPSILYVWFWIWQTSMTLNKHTGGFLTSKCS